MKRHNLTKTFVDGLSGENAPYVVGDTVLRGLELRVSVSRWGNVIKTFYVYYRTRDGQRRRPAIGKYGNLTVDEAKGEAKKILASATLGGDPSGERKKNRSVGTVEALANDFLGDCDRRLKISTAREYRRLWEVYIKGELGKRPLKSITTEDIRRVHRKFKDTPYQANRVLALMRVLFQQAEADGLISINPTRPVKPNTEEGRTRKLDEAEIKRLAGVLAKTEAEGTEPVHAVYAIRLLLLLGLRKSEVLNARWSDLNIERKTLKLRDTKTGARTVPLSSAAIAILKHLEEMKTASNDFIIEGRRHGAPMVGLQKIWERLRVKAELGDVRLHDLRHNAASWLAGMRTGASVIQALMGHADLRTSQGYIHIDSEGDPVFAATEALGETLAGFMVQDGADIIEVAPQSKVEGEKKADGNAG